MQKPFIHEALPNQPQSTCQGRLSLPHGLRRQEGREGSLTLQPEVPSAGP